MGKRRPSPPHQRPGQWLLHQLLLQQRLLLSAASNTSDYLVVFQQALGLPDSCKHATPVLVSWSAGSGHGNRYLSGAGVRTYSKLRRARWVTVASWGVQTGTVISAARRTGHGLTFLIFMWDLSGQLPFPQDNFR